MSELDERRELNRKVKRYAELYSQMNTGTITQDELAEFSEIGATVSHELLKSSMWSVRMRMCGACHYIQKNIVFGRPHIKKCKKKNFIMTKPCQKACSQFVAASNALTIIK